MPVADRAHPVLADAEGDVASRRSSPAAIARRALDHGLGGGARDRRHLRRARAPARRPSAARRAVLARGVGLRRAPSPAAAPVTSAGTRARPERVPLAACGSALQPLLPAPALAAPSAARSLKNDPHLLGNEEGGLERSQPAASFAARDLLRPQRRAVRLGGVLLGAAPRARCGCGRRSATGAPSRRSRPRSRARWPRGRARRRAARASRSRRSAPPRPRRR